MGRAFSRTVAPCAPHRLKRDYSPPGPTRWLATGDPSAAWASRLSLPHCCRCAARGSLCPEDDGQREALWCLTICPQMSIGASALDPLSLHIGSPPAVPGDQAPLGLGAVPRHPGHLSVASLKSRWWPRTTSTIGRTRPAIDGTTECPRSGPHDARSGARLLGVPQGWRPLGITVSVPHWSSEFNWT